MARIRIIARLDIKGENLIKGVHLEGLRVIGSPNEFAFDYYIQGADELIYIDSVASLYGRNNLSTIVMETAKRVFIPMTVGGGIRSTHDAYQLLRSGADKIAINTAAVARPELISDIAKEFGRQCVVLSVQAKNMSPGKWEVYTDNGRERTGLDVIEWIGKAVDLGAGEVLVTSIDREGTRKGFDVELAGAVATNSEVPVIISGGMGSSMDALNVIQNGNIDGIAIADMLHYGRSTIQNIRNDLLAAGVEVRKYGS